MMIDPKNPRRRRAGALIAIIGGGTASMIGAGHHDPAAHLEPWRLAVGIGAAILVLVAAVALIVVCVRREDR